MFNFWKIKVKASKEDVGIIRSLLMNKLQGFDWNQYDADKDISNKARKLFQEATEMWQKSKFKDAIIMFIKATEIEPDWSYPYYEIWYSYLLLKDLKKASHYYNECDKREERWFFHLKTDLFIVEETLKWKLSPEPYMEYIQIADMPTWTVRQKECEKFLTKHPEYTPMYFIYLETLLFNLELNKFKKVYEENSQSDFDIDIQMYLRILQIFFWILTGNRKQIDLLLKGIYRSDTSMDIDNIADFILQRWGKG